MQPENMSAPFPLLVSPASGPEELELKSLTPGEKSIQARHAPDEASARLRAVNLYDNK